MAKETQAKVTQLLNQPQNQITTQLPTSEFSQYPSSSQYTTITYSDFQKTQEFRSILGFLGSQKPEALVGGNFQSLQKASVNIYIFYRITIVNG